MIDLLTKPIMIGLAVVAVGGWASMGVQTLRLSSARSALIAEELDRSKVETARGLAALKETERRHETEQGWDDVKARAERDHLQELAVTEAEVAELRRRHDAAVTASDGLRKQLFDYASGGAAAKDSLAACRSRAAALGDLLAAGEAVAGHAERVAIDLSEAAERHAGEVRALLHAWPVNPLVPSN